ncbi:MAG: type IX secretion system sortase PorU [Muribaculaceae bacterium]|nr:type IX secretion system sortase PorU [Muribaculaceae bacterium]
MIKKILHTLSLVLLCCTHALALPLEHYAAESVLATGSWVKVRVDKSGLFRITSSELRKMGFSDPQKVHVYGYGGYRQPDQLTAANFIDDLPLLQSINNSDGIIFYAQGPYTRQLSSSSSSYINHTPSIYSDYSYYYLSEIDCDSREIKTTGSPVTTAPATSFIEVVHHEQELMSPAEAGAQLLGEDFRYTPTRTLSFNTPGAASGGKAWFECSFASEVFGASSMLRFSANGTELPSVSDDRIAAANTDEHYYGRATTTRHEFTHSGDRLQLQIAYQPGATCHGAWLDYVTLNYERQLSLPASGYLSFSSAGRQLQLSNASPDVIIWDVSDPLEIFQVNAAVDGNKASWTSGRAGLHHYVAFRTGATLESPENTGTVKNQNLHSLEAADMAIITFSQWQNQAERLATFHRNSPDSLKVHVLDIAEIYNEFGSGAPDVSAIRKMCKMLYDRGNDSGRPLRYVLLMGASTFDERHKLEGTRSSRPYTIPGWQTKQMSQVLSDNEGYGTDDFVGMLEDNDGANLGSAYISVAVGRIPVRTANEAKSTVDKLLQYSNESKRGTWRNRVMLIADDGNNGVHLNQSERFVKNICKDPRQQQIFTKIYIDAYDYSGTVPLVARDEMFRALDEGVMWWNFVGHGNPSKWTGNDILTYNDINNAYWRQLPVIYAATCDFLRWDSNVTSGGEILFFERNGGCVAMISATRPVNISDNGYLTNGMGHSLARRDANGRIYPIGEIYRWAKNNLYNDNDALLTGSNPNKLRFVLMGDPAMRLAMPGNIARLDSINGKALTDNSADNQIMARSLSRISGSVTDPASGEIMPDFNGILYYDLYDAEYSLTTKGHSDNGGFGQPQITYENMGGRIASGSAKVSNGKFSFTIAMPEEVAQIWRPATLNMHAVSDDSETGAASLSDAAGVNNSFYVYDTDTEVAPDTKAPTIEWLAVNHPGFTPGATVHSTPMILARVSDDRGINLSTSGIGRQMSLTLDGKTTFTDVSQYYTPDPDNNTAGDIAYPMNTLTDGNHEISLRVWDTDGNFTDARAEFFVSSDAAPEIFDLYTDANPAHTEANFYLSHNQPDATMTVTVNVYTLAGNPVWSQTQTGRSDMFLTQPLTWDLTDSGGRRVGRGIYVYRATISNGGTSHTTASRKLAVAAY